MEPSTVPVDQLKFAEDVGISFVRQYYHRIASEGLEKVEAFYGKESIFSFNGSIVAVGAENIKAQYKQLGFENAVYDLESGTFDFAPSHDGGIIIIVSGSILPSADSSAKNFTQTFFLAPQGETVNGVPSSFFVLNDIVRHSPVPQSVIEGTPLTNGSSAPEVTVKTQAKDEEACVVEIEVQENAKEVGAENQIDAKAADSGKPAEVKPAERNDEGQPTESSVSESLAEEEVPEIAEAQVEKSEVQNVAKMPSTTRAKEVDAPAANGPTRSAPNTRSRQTNNRQSNARQGRPVRPTKAQNDKPQVEPASQKKPSSWASIVSSKKDAAPTQAPPPSTAPLNDGNSVEKKAPMNSNAGPPTRFKTGPRAGYARASTSVLVKDLAKNVNEQTLRELFQVYGKIKSVDISSGKEKNFAFVIFETNSGVKNVLAESRIMLNGKELHVQEKAAGGSSGRPYGRQDRRPYRTRNSRGNENNGYRATAASNGAKGGRPRKA